MEEEKKYPTYYTTLKNPLEEIEFLQELTRVQRERINELLIYKEKYYLLKNEIDNNKSLDIVRRRN